MKSEKSPAVPAGIDELVKFIAKSVTDLYERSGQRMDGSLLAYTIRSEFPEMDYSQLGLTRLGDAVHIAENLNLVVRNRDVKHLELSPPGATKILKSASESSKMDERRYVRNDIWRAFVFRSRSMTFLDKETFKLTELPETDLKEIAALKRNSKFIQIDRIPDDEQICWAKQYIISSTDSDECSDDEAKNLIFAKTNNLNATFLRAWKASLSLNVVKYIRTWAAKNNISTNGILTPTKRRSELERFEATSDNDAALRQAIIAAIKEMPLSNLDEIAIPIKYVRRHFTAK